MKAEMKDGAPQVVMNHNGNHGKFSHLLASQDRDYLLSPTGAQVLYLSLSQNSSQKLTRELMPIKYKNYLTKLRFKHAFFFLLQQISQS